MEQRDYALVLNERPEVVQLINTIRTMPEEKRDSALILATKLCNKIVEGYGVKGSR